MHFITLTREKKKGSAKHKIKLSVQFQANFMITKCCGESRNKQQLSYKMSYPDIVAARFQIHFAMSIKHGIQEERRNIN